MKVIESTYQNDSLNLQLSQAQAVTGAFTGMFGAILGESSTAYKTLFATQKAFALAQAGMNVWKAASDAYANAQGTVWNKLAEAAIATAKSSSFITLIKLQPRKDLRMAVIPVMVLNTLQQGLCIKAKSYGRKKISNAGVVLALLKACVKVNQVVMQMEVMFLIILVKL